MRTALNVVLILVAAVVIGLAVRYSQGDRESVPQANSAVADNPIYADEAIKEKDPVAEQVDGNWLTSFSLTERSGQQIDSESLKGQPYVASFFFSTCPSICKLQNEKLQQLQTEFSGEAIKFVAITVDPEIDTPEALREYAKRYKADAEQWLFLTGDLGYIRRVGAEMFATHVEKQVHTERFFLVDGDGKVVKYYTWSDPAQFKKLKEDIRAMIGVRQEQA